MFYFWQTETLLPGNADESEEDLVAALAHAGEIQLDLIDRLVGHQNPAVAVEDVAPVGFHGLCLGDLALGLLVEFVAPDDL